MLGSTNLFSSGCVVGHILVGGKISWAAGDQSASSILYIFRRCTHLPTNVQGVSKKTLFYEIGTQAAP